MCGCEGVDVRGCVVCGLGRGVVFVGWRVCVAACRVERVGWYMCLL